MPTSGRLCGSPTMSGPAHRGVARFVEVGPDAVLTAMVAEISDTASAVPLLRKDRHEPIGP